MSIDFATLKGLEIPEGKVKSILITESDGTVYEVGFVKIITFEVYNSASFQSTTYQAEEGMTWAEWCGSEYDTNVAHIDGDGKVYPAYHIHGYLTDVRSSGVIIVRSSDVIIEGMVYTIAIGGGSND